MSLTISENTRASVLFVIAAEDGVLNEERYSFWLIGPLMELFEVGIALITMADGKDEFDVAVCAEDDGIGGGGGGAM